VEEGIGSLKKHVNILNVLLPSRMILSKTSNHTTPELSRPTIA